MFKASGSHKRYFMLNLDELHLTYFKSSAHKKYKASKKYTAGDFIRLTIDDISVHRNWNYGFKLHTKERHLHLFAFSEFDRDVWLKAFQALFRKINAKHPQSNLDTTIYDGQGIKVKPGKTFQARGKAKRPEIPLEQSI